MFSEHEKLNDQAIIASGNIGKLARVSSDTNSSGNSSFTHTEIYQIGNWCFSSDAGLAGKAGLLLVDRGRSVSVGVLTMQISGIKVLVRPTTLLDCSALQQEDFKTLMNQIEAQRKQTEALIQSLRRQQQNQRKSPQ